jgi:hypothetical protein
LARKEKAPEDKESLEPSKGHLLAFPLHNDLQKVRGYAVRLTRPQMETTTQMIELSKMLSRIILTKFFNPRKQTDDPIKMNSYLAAAM